MYSNYTHQILLMGEILLLDHLMELKLRKWFREWLLVQVDLV